MQTNTSEPIKPKCIYMLSRDMLIEVYAYAVYRWVYAVDIKKNPHPYLCLQRRYEIVRRSYQHMSFLHKQEWM